MITCLAFLINPIRIYLPKRFLCIDYININVSNISVLCVLLLLSTTKFDYIDALNGLKGDMNGINNDGIRPWEIIGILISVLYCCLSLNATGIFTVFGSYIFNKIVKTNKVNIKNHLYIYTIIFTILTSLSTNTDISIIVVTPFIISICIAQSINPEPFLLVTLFISNSLGMIFLTKGIYIYIYIYVHVSIL